MSLFHEVKAVLDSLDDLAAEVSDSDLSEEVSDALFMGIDQATEVLKEVLSYL